MTASTRLAAHRASASSAAEHKPANPDMPDNEETGEKKDKKKMTDTTKEQEAALAHAAADATKAANARFSAVLASEHYAGREALAKNLLATDLSAEQITAALADAPKTEATGASAEDIEKAKEEGARETMKAALGSEKNSEVDPNGGDKSDKKQAASGDIWKQAIAANNPGLKLA